MYNEELCFGDFARKLKIQSFFHSKLNNMKQQIKQGYNKIGEDYNNRRIAKKELNYQYFENLFYLFPIKGKLLDIGCGGAVPATSFFFEKGFDIVGIDISEKMIDLAKTNIPQGNFIVGDISEMSFEKESFDVIISTYAFIHIPFVEQKPLIAKIYDWLKTGGKVFLNLNEEKYKQHKNEDWHGTEMYWSSLGKEEYCKLFNKIGFKMIWSETEHLLNGEVFYNVILEK